MAESAPRPTTPTPRAKRPRVLDWTSDLDAAEREELETLRAAVGEREDAVEQLRAELRRTQRRLNDYRAALRLLHASRPWQRPGVWQEIRRRGMLS